jgi:hypothetical protein
MGRKDESILNSLVECPWWVSLLVSGAAFVSLRFILPTIDFKSTRSRVSGLRYLQMLSIIKLVQSIRTKMGR